MKFKGFVRFAGSVFPFIVLTVFLSVNWQSGTAYYVIPTELCGVFCMAGLGVRDFPCLVLRFTGLVEYLP